jgi:hypothetical protein
MFNRHLRIIALLLIPCLAVDPALAGSLARPVPLTLPANPKIYEQQALATAALTSLRAPRQTASRFWREISRVRPPRLPNLALPEGLRFPGFMMMAGEEGASGSNALNMANVARIREQTGLTVLRTLGGRSEATVYEAVDASGRHVALRIDNIPRKYQNRGFEAVLQKLGSDRHPALPELIRSGVFEGWPALTYQVMELRRGRTIEDLLRTDFFSNVGPHRTVHAIRQILEGFDFLYRHNIYHGDPFSAQILVDEEGNVSILDIFYGQADPSPLQRGIDGNMSTWVQMSLQMLFASFQADQVPDPVIADVARAFEQIRSRYAHWDEAALGDGLAALAELQEKLPEAISSKVLPSAPSDPPLTEQTLQDIAQITNAQDPEQKARLLARLIEGHARLREEINQFRQDMGTIDTNSRILFEGAPDETPLLSVSFVLGQIHRFGPLGAVVYSMRGQSTEQMISQKTFFNTRLIDHRGHETTLAALLREIPELRGVPEEGLPIEQNARVYFDPESGQLTLERESRRNAGTEYVFGYSEKGARIHTALARGLDWEIPVSDAKRLIFLMHLHPTVPEFPEGDRLLPSMADMLSMRQRGVPYLLSSEAGEGILYVVRDPAEIDAILASDAAQKTLRYAFAEPNLRQAVINRYLASAPVRLTSTDGGEGVRTKARRKRSIPPVVSVFLAALIGGAIAYAAGYSPEDMRGASAFTVPVWMLGSIIGVVNKVAFKLLPSRYIKAIDEFCWQQLPKSDDLLIELFEWLKRSPPLMWNAGPRYGQAHIQFRENDITTIEVYPSDLWAKTADGQWRFPEMRKLEFQREDGLGWYPNPGSFGQIMIMIRLRADGQPVVVIDEIQPADGYRLLSHTQRHQLDSWRRNAVEKIAEWAQLKKLAIYASTPEEMAGEYKRMKPPELRINYADPFVPSAWQKKSVVVFNPMASAIGLVWFGPLERHLWWSHKQNRTSPRGFLRLARKVFETIRQTRASSTGTPGAITVLEEGGGARPIALFPTILRGLTPEGRRSETSDILMMTETWKPVGSVDIEGVERDLNETLPRVRPDTAWKVKAGGNFVNITFVDKVQAMKNLMKTPALRNKKFGITLGDAPSVDFLQRKDAEGEDPFPVPFAQVLAQPEDSPVPEDFPNVKKVGKGEEFIEQFLRDLADASAQGPDLAVFLREQGFDVPFYIGPLKPEDLLIISDIDGTYIGNSDTLGESSEKTTPRPGLKDVTVELAAKGTHWRFLSGKAIDEITGTRSQSDLDRLLVPLADEFKRRTIPFDRVGYLGMVGLQDVSLDAYGQVVFAHSEMASGLRPLSLEEQRAISDLARSAIEKHRHQQGTDLHDVMDGIRMSWRYMLPGLALGFLGAIFISREAAPWLAALGTFSAWSLAAFRPFSSRRPFRGIFRAA